MPDERDSPQLEVIEQESCPHCFALNDLYANFCANCNFPMSQRSTLDPIASIQAEGHFYRKAAAMRPNRFVVFCVWLLFLPGLLASGYAAIAFAFNASGIEGFVFFWICMLSAIFCGYMLFRVTANYLAAPQKKE